MEYNKILQGHVLDVLKTLPSESIHVVITSPPYYALRSYSTEPQTWGGDPACPHQWQSQTTEKEMHQTGARGRGSPTTTIHRATIETGLCSSCGAWRGELGNEPTPDLYITHLVEIFREIRRVLRNDGTLWCNMGDSYAANRSKQVPDSKWHDVGNNQGASVPFGMKPKDLMGIPWMLAFALRADGWYLRSDIIFHKINAMPESVTDRPGRAHEYLFLLTKSARYYYDAHAIREAPLKWHGSKPETYEGKSLANWIKRTGRLQMPDKWNNPAGRNKRSVWTISSEPLGEKHYAAFPQKLIKPCILAGSSERGVCPTCGNPWKRILESTPEYKKLLGKSYHDDSKRGVEYGLRQGGSSPKDLKGMETYVTAGWQLTCPHEGKPIPATILDPFSGSGTTLLVAEKLGRRWLGIELNPDYINIAQHRLKSILQQPRLPLQFLDGF